VAGESKSASTIHGTRVLRESKNNDIDPLRWLRRGLAGAQFGDPKNNDVSDVQFC
jgi:hypothetical protein